MSLVRRDPARGTVVEVELVGLCDSCVVALRESVPVTAARAIKSRRRFNADA